MGGMLMSHVTAIIQAYNEQISIGSVILSSRTYADRIIVIDNGSNDKTSEVAELAGAEIIHNENKSREAAIKAGFNAAKDSDIIITIDGDGLHKPSEIPKLLKPIINGEADIVNGSRYMDTGKTNSSSYEHVKENMPEIPTNTNTDTHVTDSQSGFRAFAGHTIPLFHFKESNFGIETEMLIEASNANLRIKEVEISGNYNVNAIKQNPLKQSVGIFVKLLQDIEFNRPLYYFTLPGVVLIIIGLSTGLIFFSQYLAGQSHSLAATTLSALLTIGGGFIAFTGILLHSMGRMIDRAMSKR